MIYRIATALIRAFTALANLTRPTTREMEDRMVRIANRLQAQADATRARASEALDASNELEMQAYNLYDEASNADQTAASVLTALNRGDTPDLFA